MGSLQALLTALILLPDALSASSFFRGLDHDRLATVTVHAEDASFGPEVTRFRRSTRGMPGKLNIRFRMGDDVIHLQLTRNLKLDWSPPVFVVRDGRAVTPGVEDVQEDVAFYQDVASGAAMMVKRRREGDGGYELLGTYFRGQNQFIVEPMVERSANMTSHINHTVSLLTQDVDLHADMLDAGLVPTTEGQEGDKGESPRRVRRQALQHVVEVLMVVDNAIYQKWYNEMAAESDEEEDLEEKTKRAIRQYYAFVLNGVDLRYSAIQDPELKIGISFAGLVIFDDPTEGFDTRQFATPGKPRDLVESTDALEAFRFWALANPNQLPPSDHVMLFTGYNLTYGGSASNAGLAYIKSACNPDYYFSIVEEYFEFRIVSIAAHELGHSLGARHDMDGNLCLAYQLYIMTPRFKFPSKSLALNPWQFSQCSVDYFKEYIDFLNQNTTNCLLTTNAERNSSELAGFLVDQPGQIYTPDEQCQRAYGNDSYACRENLQAVSDYESICSLGLGCHDANLFLTCSKILPADGTLCGDQKWCYNGSCIFSESAPQSIDACPFGDQPGPVAGGRNCSARVEEAPWDCYSEPFRAQCCQSCSAIYSSVEGCEYGDRFGGCIAKQCPTYDTRIQKENCCGSCGYLFGITTPTTTTTTTTPSPTTSQQQIPTNSSHGSNGSTPSPEVAPRPRIRCPEDARPPQGRVSLSDWRRWSMIREFCRRQEVYQRRVSMRQQRMYRMRMLMAMILSRIQTMRALRVTAVQGATQDQEIPGDRGQDRREEQRMRKLERYLDKLRERIRKEEEKLLKEEAKERERRQKEEEKLQNDLEKEEARIERDIAHILNGTSSEEDKEEKRLRKEEERRQKEIEKQQEEERKREEDARKEAEKQQKKEEKRLEKEEQERQRALESEQKRLEKERRRLLRDSGQRDRLLFLDPRNPNQSATAARRRRQAMEPSSSSSGRSKEVQSRRKRFLRQLKILRNLRRRRDSPGGGPKGNSRSAMRRAIVSDLLRLALNLAGAGPGNLIQRPRRETGKGGSQGNCSAAEQAPTVKVEGRNGEAHRRGPDPIMDKMDVAPLSVSQESQDDSGPESASPELAEASVVSPVRGLTRSQVAGRGPPGSPWRPAPSTVANGQGQGNGRGRGRGQGQGPRGRRSLESGDLSLGSFSLDEDFISASSSLESGDGDDSLLLDLIDDDDNTFEVGSLEIAEATMSSSGDSDDSSRRRRRRRSASSGSSRDSDEDSRRRRRRRVRRDASSEEDGDDNSLPDLNDDNDDDLFDVQSLEIAEATMSNSQDSDDGSRRRRRDVTSENSGDSEQNSRRRLRARRDATSKSSKDSDEDSRRRRRRVRRNVSLDEEGNDSLPLDLNDDNDDDTFDVQSLEIAEATMSNSGDSDESSRRRRRDVTSENSGDSEENSRRRRRARRDAALKSSKDSDEDSRRRRRRDATSDNSGDSDEESRRRLRRDATSDNSGDSDEDSRRRRRRDATSENSGDSDEDSKRRRRRDTTSENSGDSDEDSRRRRRRDATSENSRDSDEDSRRRRRRRVRRDASSGSSSRSFESLEFLDSRSSEEVGIGDLDLLLGSGERDLLRTIATLLGDDNDILGSSSGSASGSSSRSSSEEGIDLDLLGTLLGRL